MVLALHDTARQSLEETLQAAGAEVESVTSPQAALMAAMFRANAAQKLQAAVIEATPGDDMPLELAKRLSSPGLGLKLPVVMILPAGDLAAASQCRGNDRITALTKPAKPSEIVAAVQYMLTQIHEADAITTTEIEDAPTTNSAPLRILLADDSPVNQEVAMGLLELEGHTVTAVDDGRSAVNAWEAGEFDVLLLDIEMPELDGLSATQEIRAREAELGDGRRVPIYAMTAHAIQGYRETCLAAGMDGYITKPIQLEELHEVLTTVAAQRERCRALTAS